MSGFSYKNLLLQIIHGSIIIVTLIFLSLESLQYVIEFFKSYESTAVALFLFLSFIIGVIIDFISDILESLVLKFIIIPPIYYLLAKERWWGIALAHKEFILKELCRIAAEFKVNDTDKAELKEYYQNIFQEKKPAKTDKKDINYILQVAKNKAFRNCKDYQKEQIDSFFVLYIFSRNISVSLLFSIVVLCFYSRIILSIGLFAIVLLTLASSYRYYLYYSRILLGAIIQKEKKVN
jgi:hypothetical protein